MLKSLRVKLIVILVILIVSVVVIVGTVLINSVAIFYNDSFIERVELALLDEGLREELEQYAAEQNPAMMAERLQSYSGRMAIDSINRNFFVLDSGGGYAAGPNEHRGRSLEKTPNMLAAMQGEPGDARDHFAGYMDYAMPVGDYIVYVLDSKEEVRALSYQILIIIVQAMFIGLIIAIVLSFFLSTTITGPIVNLTHGSERIMTGDFSHKLEKYSSDEIGTLTETFNNMAGALKSTLDDVQRERNKLETLFLYMADGVLAFDQDGVLLHSNPAARRLLRAAPIIGQARFDEIMSFFGGSLRFGDLLELQSFKNIVLDAPLHDKNVRIFFAPFKLAGSGGGDSSGGIIAVMHDTTEQQRLEEMRRQFVADVSHELRTPLTNIKSYAETLQEGEDLPPDMRDRFLGVILSETDRMTRIVSDLLMLSRLNSETTEWEYKPYSVEKQMRGVHEMMLVEAEAHGHALELSVAPDAGELTADRDRIEQVLVNIVGNAIKYTPDGGRIVMAACSDGDWVEISVEDNGIGIPEDDLPHIYERFYRVDKARSREQGGTGLGLSIASEIVQSHGGAVRAESSPGRGTRMIVRLPRQGPAGRDRQGEG